MRDFYRGLDLAEALGIGTGGRVISVVIPGPPWSKMRARFTRGRTYAPQSDVDAETRTGLYLASVVKGQPFTGNVGLGCVFYRPTRQRIDTDNLIKHVCDAATGVVWKDDSQCTAVMGFLELDAEDPRTVIVIGDHESTMTRGTDAVMPCPVCDKPMPIASYTRKTCSKACSIRLQGRVPIGDPIACPQCGEMFVRVSQYRQFCSQQCAGASLRGKRRARATERPYCTACGKQLTHLRGGRCRDCWRADPSGADVTVSVLDSGETAK